MPAAVVYRHILKMLHKEATKRGYVSLGLGRTRARTERSCGQNHDMKTEGAVVARDTISGLYRGRSLGCCNADLRAWQQSGNNREMEA